MAVFVVVNYFGIRWFARINNALVTWKIFIILLAIVAFAATAFHGSNFTSQGFAPNGAHGVFTAIATSGIVFSYLGFRQGIELAGETDNPKRNVPLAVIGSVLITAVIYIALQIAFIGSLDGSFIADGWENLSLGNNGDSDFGPLAQLASFLGLSWLAVLLYIDAIVSPGDTGLIYTTVTARISFAMSRNGNAPRALSTTTDKGVPLVGLLLSFVIGLIAFLPFPSWQQLVGFVELGHRALLRLGPARPGRAAQAAPRDRASVPAARRSRRAVPRLLGLQHDRLLVGLDGRVEADARRADRLRAAGHLHGHRRAQGPEPRLPRRASGCCPGWAGSP